jgi:ABC-type Fe3+/spermidine/putrescine transport system ATPase subunit
MLHTSAGTLTPDEPPTTRGDCLVSIRPEAIKLSSSGRNLLRGRVVETTYLGEIAHHTIALAGGERLQTAEMNPGPPPSPVDDVSLSIDPRDVIVISID